MNYLRDAPDYFIANQDRLVRQFPGKVIVIKNGIVLGSYDDELQAVLETQKKEPVGTFLVQRAAPGPEAYMQTFHSRVVLP